MNITQSTDIDVTLASALPGPAGVQLGTVQPGSRLVESQCTLALSGAAGPFTCHLLYTPAVAGPDVMGSQTAPGPVPATMLGIAPVVDQAPGTLALVVEEGLPEGARLTGRLVTVRGAI
jgi:hypothetical protein